jgi:hypothetical protein
MAGQVSPSAHRREPSKRPHEEMSEEKKQSSPSAAGANIERTREFLREAHAQQAARVARRG